jgi:hypothetical protein
LLHTLELPGTEIPFGVIPVVFIGYLECKALKIQIRDCDYSPLEDLAVEALGLVLIQDQPFSSFAICVEDQALRVVILV